MEVAEGREPSGFAPGGLRRTAKSFGPAKIPLCNSKLL